MEEEILDTSARYDINMNKDTDGTRFDDFVSCPICSSKPGSPKYCMSCYSNMMLIATQRAEIKKLMSEVS